MLKEHRGWLPIFRSPNQQIEDMRRLIASVGLEDHIIPVKNLNEATEKIVAIIDNLRNDNPNQVLTRPTVFCDFDGVIRSDLMIFPWERKMTIFRALRRLVKIAGSFTLWSSRIVIDTDIYEGKIAELINRLIEGNNAISRFPFFTNQSLRRLFSFLHKSNPECDIKFNCGLKKINGKDPFIEKAINILNQDQFLFIIASSFFDRKRVKKIINFCRQNNINLNRFFYLDTGRWVY